MNPGSMGAQKNGGVFHVEGRRFGEWYRIIWILSLNFKIREDYIEDF